MLAKPNMDDECQDTTKEKYSYNAEQYCHGGADRAALLPARPCVAGALFDWGWMNAAVRNRDVTGWVAAEEIRHGNPPFTSEIHLDFTTCRPEIPQRAVIGSGLQNSPLPREVAGEHSGIGHIE
jgi:hypothetical protein